MNLNDLVPAAYVLGMVGVIGGIMLTIMSSLALTGNAAMFMGNASTGLLNLAVQLGLVGTVIGLVVVLGVVMYSFGNMGRQRQ